MADALTFAAISLATYRLATDLAWEAGPLGWYAALRGRVATWGPTWAEGVTCPICLSFWFAPLAFLLWYWAPALVWWLAAAGLAALLARRGA